MSEAERPLERILDKLAEARFFYVRFAPCSDIEKAGFYCSAFVSATRSVTFTVHAVCSHLPDFKTWYERERATLRASAVAGYLLELRNETQKVGLAPVHYRGVGSRVSRAGRFHCQLMFRLVALDQGLAPPVPDARAAAGEYLSLLGALVSRCYAQFCGAIDPEQRLRFAVLALTKPLSVRAPVCSLDSGHRRLAPRKYLLDGAALARATVAKKVSQSSRRRRKAG